MIINYTNFKIMKNLIKHLCNALYLVLSLVLSVGCKAQLTPEQKEKEYIDRFRAEMMFWGHNTSQLTDDEIKEGIQRTADIITKTGFTVDDITKAMIALPK